jgi:hypothetical protein
MRLIDKKTRAIRPIEAFGIEALVTTEDDDGLKQQRELLLRIKLRLMELEDLLCQAEKAQEEYVYRFYHRSYKSIYIQAYTRVILESLHTLAPTGTELNSQLLKIVTEGYQSLFQEESDQNRDKETRSIIEGFFHTKFFLQMAVKYGKKLDALPELLPSGWAALLHLYNLR